METKRQVSSCSSGRDAETERPGGESPCWPSPTRSVARGPARVDVGRLPRVSGRDVYCAATSKRVGGCFTDAHRGPYDPRARNLDLSSTGPAPAPSPHPVSAALGPRLTGRTDRPGAATKHRPRRRTRPYTPRRPRPEARDPPPPTLAAVTPRPVARGSRRPGQPAPYSFAWLGQRNLVLATRRRPSRRRPSRRRRDLRLTADFVLDADCPGRRRLGATRRLRPYFARDPSTPKRASPPPPPRPGSETRPRRASPGAMEGRGGSHRQAG